MIPKVATTSKSTSLPQVPVIPTKNSVNIAVHPTQVPTVTDDMENAVFTVGTEHMKGRMASKRIYPGLKTEDIPVTQSAELLAKLLGSWDPMTKTYAKMSDIMALMQTAIDLGGGPVHGINWTSRVREISKN